MNKFNIPPAITTINPVIKNPDMKLKSFFETTTYMDNPANVMAVNANASAAIDGPT